MDRLSRTASARPLAASSSWPGRRREVPLLVPARSPLPAVLAGLGFGATVLVAALGVLAQEPRSPDAGNPLAWYDLPGGSATSARPSWLDLPPLPLPAPPGPREEPDPFLVAVPFGPPQPLQRSNPTPMGPPQPFRGSAPQPVAHLGWEPLGPPQPLRPARDGDIADLAFAPRLLGPPQRLERARVAAFDQNRPGPPPSERSAPLPSGPHGQDTGQPPQALRAPEQDSEAAPPSAAEAGAETGSIRRAGTVTLRGGSVVLRVRN